jgi:hypothetical protein
MATRLSRFTVTQTHQRHTFRHLGIDPADIGRFLSTSGAFIHATDVDKAWEAVQELAVTLDVD